MGVCHHCGQDMPERVQWRGLLVNEACEAYWRGIKVPLQAAQARILRALMRTGQASHFALEMVGTSAGGACIKVQICKIRRKLREAGVPIEIRVMRHIGYELVH